MEQRLSLVTLGVDDLARARRFYETGLGWAPAAVHEGVTFYQLPGIAFALWDRAEMAAEVPVPAGNGFGGVTIAVNQRSEADVDAALACACRFPQSCAACARTMARLLDAVLFTSGEGLAAA